MNVREVIEKANCDNALKGMVRMALRSFAPDVLEAEVALAIDPAAERICLAIGGATVLDTTFAEAVKYVGSDPSPTTE